jgi:4-alpha-glucanotransferase
LPGWAWRADDTPEHRAANRADGDLRLKVILEAAQGGEVVGEDLGFVPEYVRPHLASLGIAGFRIPHWDADEDGHVIPPEELPECSFATYATHDHDTLMAMWCDLVHETEDLMAEPDDREKAANYLKLLCEFAGLPVKDGKWPPGSPELRWRLVDRLFASNSRLAAVMVTDVFGMTERFNRPGTVGGNNWRLRLPWTVGEIRANPALAGECERLALSIAAGDR